MCAERQHNNIVGKKKHTQPFDMGLIIKYGVAAHSASRRVHSCKALA